MQQASAAAHHLMFCLVLDLSSHIQQTNEPFAMKVWLQPTQQRSSGARVFGCVIANVTLLLSLKYVQD